MIIKEHYSTAYSIISTVLLKMFIGTGHLFPYNPTTRYCYWCIALFANEVLLIEKLLTF